MLMTELEVWLCWACGGQFESWGLETEAQCPRCGARNYRGSFVIPDITVVRAEDIRVVVHKVG